MKPTQSHTSFFYPIVLVMVLLLALSGSAFAQGGNAQLGGVVEDPSKALVPGVTVTAAKPPYSAEDADPSNWIEALATFGTMRVVEASADQGPWAVVSKLKISKGWPEVRRGRQRSATRKPKRYFFISLIDFLK